MISNESINEAVENPLIKSQKKDLRANNNLISWMEINTAKKKRKLQDMANKKVNEDDEKSFQQRIREEGFHKKCTDPRFEAGLFVLDTFDDLQPSLVINLYEKHFSLENQGVPHAYSKSAREFIRAVDSQRLPPDLADLLDDSHCQYYDGCLIVELRDFRGEASLDSNNPAAERASSVHKIILRPDTSSIIHDIEQICNKSQQEWTQDEVIALEQKILLATQDPICLDPSPKVAYVNNFLNYNLLKFNNKSQKSLRQKNIIQLEELTQEGNYKFPLLKYLKTHQNDIPQTSLLPSSQETEQPFSITVHQTINYVLHKILARKDSRPPSVNNNPSELAQLLNRRMRFLMNQGKTFCTFQIFPKRTGGFEGMLRVGRTPDVGNNGDVVRFPIGNVHSAEVTISQLKSLYEREGASVLVYDQLDENEESQNMKPHPQSLLGNANNASGTHINNLGALSAMNSLGNLSIGNLNNLNLNNFGMANQAKFANPLLAPMAGGGAPGVNVPLSMMEGAMPHNPNNLKPELLADTKKKMAQKLGNTSTGRISPSTFAPSTTTTGMPSSMVPGQTVLLQNIAYPTASAIQPQSSLLASPPMSGGVMFRIPQNNNNNNNNNNTPSNAILPPTSNNPNQ